MGNKDNAVEILKKLENSLKEIKSCKEDHKAIILQQKLAEYLLENIASNHDLKETILKKSIQNKKNA